MAKRPAHAPATPEAPAPGRRGELDEYKDLIEDRLDEMADIFDGDVMDAETWALIQEHLMPERFKAPPIDPKPIPPLFVGNPECRVYVMELRARHGLALHSPHDPPKPDWADGSRGLTSAGAG